MKTKKLSGLEKANTRALDWLISAPTWVSLLVEAAIGSAIGLAIGLYVIVPYFGRTSNGPVANPPLVEARMQGCQLSSNEANERAATFTTLEHILAGINNTSAALTEEKGRESIGLFDHLDKAFEEGRFEDVRKYLHLEHDFFRNNVVIIKDGNGAGRGHGIRLRDDYIVTAAHLFWYEKGSFKPEAMRGYSAYDWAGNLYSIDTVVVAPGADIALLHAKVVKGSPRQAGVSLRQSGVTKGESIYVITTNELAYNGGPITYGGKVLNGSSSVNGSASGFTASIPAIFGGHSGSPVVSSNLELLGLVYGKDNSGKTVYVTGIQKVIPLVQAEKDYLKSCASKQ